MGTSEHDRAPRESGAIKPAGQGREELSRSDPARGEMPGLAERQSRFDEAKVLVDDLVLKQYLSKLRDFEITPIDEIDARLRRIESIRIFKVTEMVYQKDEYATYKFASVFDAVQSLNCGVFIILDSDGEKTTFYMGVRAFDDRYTTGSLEETLRNALSGQFPGVKTDNLLDPDAEKLREGMAANGKNVAVVSCVAHNKDDALKDNEVFLQGLEKFAFAMREKKYTAVVLAKSTPREQLAQIRQAYETIYTHLSPFASMQESYGSNRAMSVSEAFASGRSQSSSHGESFSRQDGTNTSKSTGEFAPDKETMRTGVIGSMLLGVAEAVAAPLISGIESMLSEGAEGVAAPLTVGAGIAAAGASIAAAGALGGARAGLGLAMSKRVSSGTTTGESHSTTTGQTDTRTESRSQTETTTTGQTSGTSENRQLTVQNKTILDILGKIELQLRRLDECESLGMWECAAYFLSESLASAEMAAGTYKALIRGDKSGVENSAINVWGGARDRDKLKLLNQYITSFVHPVFQYNAQFSCTPASLVSGNELAIHMGLPRKSICGFPVIEHAEFGQEVVKYGDAKEEKEFPLGKVFSMGSAGDVEVRLGRDSLTMHTFVTGSTGAGKSNTIYEILNRLRADYHIPFLVVEPAKGEYKNVFAQYPDVTVYGTNPKKFSHILRLDPFAFPPDVHVLEHLDRLVEIFNVCWPMYAAMPAVLKEAIERAYVSVGWDLTRSENPQGDIYPNFFDVLRQIDEVMDRSKYSDETKGDYIGALSTRVRSLTTGLNGAIFCQGGQSDAELFDRSAIVDLSRIGSVETKSLIMGLLVMKLNEYRMSSAQSNRALSHLTVLEEAHTLLRRTSTEQTSEGANLLGKSVELLANSIAEMRTYGEGFVIADQSPGLLDLSVIRNTNTKIILRLPDQQDRELVGRAANLNDAQIQELAKLERGVAAIYQNDWVEPVLVKIQKCGVEEKPYEDPGAAALFDGAAAKRKMISLLIQGRVAQRLDLDAASLRDDLGKLRLSSADREFLKKQIEEYQAAGTLRLWKEENFKELSRRLIDLLGLSRDQVEAAVRAAGDNQALTDRLKEIAASAWPGAPEDVVMALCKCLMRAVSDRREEAEWEGIYENWQAAVRRGEIKW